MKYVVTLNDREYEVDVDVCDAAIVSERTVTPAAPAPAAPAAPAAAPAAAPLAAGETVAAPMPGNILSVNVSQGQAVKAGDILVILEAMKMENEIVAPRDGTIAQVVTTKGAVVETGAPLIVLQ